jgi:ribosomal protein S18 acetylase RimI-like enzyme
VIRQLDLSDEARTKELLALQQASYAVEAALIGTSDIPPLKDTPETLARCGETFYGYFEGDSLVGAISYKIENDTLDIHRLVVRPDRFRKGIGRSLVAFVEEIEPGPRRIVVSTGAGNRPAKNLYLSLGFRKTNETEVAPGLRVALFEKEL